MSAKIHAYHYAVNRHTCPDVIHNRDMEKVGDRIRRLRLARKLTQGQVAKAIGVTQGSFTQLETGKSKAPASSTLTKLARYFEVDPEWLMTGKGAQTSISTLADDESELILLYRALSSESRQYVLGRARSVHQDEHTHAHPHRRKEDSDGPSPPAPAKNEGH
jgi:transcriptional regulator with XRE-family HTH domain